MTTVRALAFGDLDGSGWGAAWIPDGAAAMLALGAGRDAVTVPTSLEVEAENWRLESRDTRLTLSPLAELESTDHPRQRGEGFDQLCQVTGRLCVGGEPREVDCLGLRFESAIEIDDDRLDSLRLLSAWFGSDEALALLALRPRKGDGQESDVISVALREPRIAGEISDPRLSTTYGENGHPIRAGVELWIAAPASDDDAEEAEQQFPRRLAGEALGARLDWTVDGLSLHAALFRWRSRERDGAGIYLLGSRR